MERASETMKKGAATAKNLDNAGSNWMWEGRRQGSVRLRVLLDPRVIRAHAVTALSNPVDATNYAALVDNYERELRSGFPDQFLEECLASVEEVRPPGVTGLEPVHTK